MQKISYAKFKSGFTFVELLVAVLAASIVSLIALNIYVQYHKCFLHLYNSNQKETSALIDSLQRSKPYYKGLMYKSR